MWGIGFSPILTSPEQEVEAGLAVAGASPEALVDNCPEVQVEAVGVAEVRCLVIKACSLLAVWVLGVLAIKSLTPRL